MTTAHVLEPVACERHDRGNDYQPEHEVQRSSNCGIRRHIVGETKHLQQLNNGNGIEEMPAEMVCDDTGVYWSPARAGLGEPAEAVQHESETRERAWRRGQQCNKEKSNHPPSGLIDGLSSLRNCQHYGGRDNCHRHRDDEPQGWLQFVGLVYAFADQEVWAERQQTQKTELDELLVDSSSARQGSVELRHTHARYFVMSLAPGQRDRLRAG